MNESRLRARIAGFRDEHPELLFPLTWTRLREMLSADERIVVLKHRSGPKARIRAMGDVAVISFRVRLAPRDALFSGAHELAHWLLHGTHDEPTRGYISRRHRADDPLEIEADFLARCLIAGPDVHVPWPAPVAAPEQPARPARPAVLPRAPNVLPPPAWSPYDDAPRHGTWPRVPQLAVIFDPYSPEPIPVAPQRRTPAVGTRFSSQMLAATLRRVFPRRARERERIVQRPKDAIRYSLDGTVSFCDVDGVWWQLHDVRVSFDELGQARQQEVSPESLRARRRYFVRVDDGARRFYTFGRGELHNISLKHLDRQLRDSKCSPVNKSRQTRATAS